MPGKTKIMSSELEARRWPYYVLLPVTLILSVWVMCKKKFNALFSRRNQVGLLLFDGIGRYGNVIKQNAAGWKAVDLIYNHQFGADRTIGGRLDDFWFESLNCQAARNRFRLAKQQLTEAILAYPAQDEIRVASLAAGTGQIESETVAGVKKERPRLKIILMDREVAALERAQEVAARNNVQDQIQAINFDVTHAFDVLRKFRPHIIEMVAFLDYLPEREAVDFISKIYQILPENGYFITSNSMPNIEMHFVKWVVGWPLIYRRPPDISNMLNKGGFTYHQIITEPLRIQNIVVARKQRN